MPLYEYKCPKCKQIRDVILSFSETNYGVVCAECGGPMEKAVASSSFVLKGGGWANEGYGK